MTTTVIDLSPIRAVDSLAAALATETALAMLRDSDARECSRCFDQVGILNSSDECLACEEERASRPECDECDAAATSFWPNLLQPVKLCDSCEHNARRSGWEPGA